MENLKAMYLRELLAGVLLFLVILGTAQSGPVSKGPVIISSFASEKGAYGTIWKIFIEAEDTGAEMTKIAAVVDQPGQGHYPTDFILLDPQHRNYLKGYLQWNTFSSRGAALKEGDQITLRISIIDKAGNESKEVVFPFTFVSGVPDQPKVPPFFDRGDIPRIGHISIDLISPWKGNAP